ncbi:MAG: amidohydrolase family protein [Acidobacteriota bacterium]
MSRHTMRSIVLLLAATLSAAAQQPETSGTFVLHKFARAIGKETYSIKTTGDAYTLTSDFLFTDRSSRVPLKTTFTATTANMQPLSYNAKGQASRQSEMDDTLTLKGNDLSITRTGKSTTEHPTGPWFITDGYSPVAMQEQMMRWWLSHNKPAAFTVYPANATVHITPAETLSINNHPAHGYTVSGLIWGQEALWLDDATNLVALVSTDAEFDHFEAIREPYAADLGTFIAAAVKANLQELARLSATARMPAAKHLAIVGATLEDSTDAPAIPDSVILIDDGIITAAGPRSKVKIPKHATIVDAHGKFAIPGLWDMHAHYEQVEWGPIYLAAGVTSVRDVGNEFDFITTIHDQLNRKQNPAIGPHLEFAGIIDGSGTDGKRNRTLGAVIADTPEKAQQLVAKYKAAGARQIKIYSSVSPEIVKAITTAAHSLGMTVTGHIPDGMTAIDGINDGMDQINHIQYVLPYFAPTPKLADGKPDRKAIPKFDPDSPAVHDLIAALKAHHTVLDPTLVVFQSDFLTTPLETIEPGITHVPPQLRAALDAPAMPPAFATRGAAFWTAMLGSVRALHAAGIPIVAGTDQSIPGYSLHQELELYVQCGFTPLEALQSATIESAKAVGVEAESGSLTPGKRGDVLLLDADPLADIHNTRKVWRTIAAGAVYDPTPLWQSVDFKP